MGIDDLVYSISYGIGRIKRNIGNKYLVQFEYDEIALNEHDLYLISPILVDYIKNDKWHDYFTLRSIENGEKYFENGNVRSVAVMGNSITATVVGNMQYDTTINITNRGIKASCSCPVGNNCKHAVAALAYLKKIFNKLGIKRDELNKTSGTNELIFKSITLVQL